MYILGNAYFIGDILIGREVLKRLGRFTYDFEKKYIQINKFKIPIMCLDERDSQCLQTQKEDIYREIE